MRKRLLLVMAPVAIALVALLVACGTSNGPELHFDATAYDAAEVQPADAVIDTDLVSHDRIVQFAKSASLSASRTAHPMEATGRYEASLVSTSYAAESGFPAESNAKVAAASPVTGQTTASDGNTGVQPAPGTPEAVLQDASFALVTVETDEGEQVIFMPSKDYTKVCPHRLRMASEFSDMGAADF